MLFQSLAVLAHDVIKSQVQLVEGQSLLRVRCPLPRGVVISFLFQTNRISLNERNDQCSNEAVAQCTCSDQRCLQSLQ